METDRRVDLNQLPNVLAQLVCYIWNMFILMIIICFFLQYLWCFLFIDSGFIKFLEPYYMLLVTGRKKIGVICGHAVYSIKKSEIIPIPHSSVLSNLAYSKNEKRSFVNSACKCNMYLVRIKRHVNLASSVVHYSLYLDENLCHCLIVLLLSIKLCWTNCLCFGILKQTSSTPVEVISVSTFVSKPFIV